MDDPEAPIPETDGEFAFETDPLALRSNKDYCDLLKYIVKLEAQKIQALKDIEEISHAENRALEDPSVFVENLKSGNINFPTRQVIDDLPKIEWSKYNIDTSPRKNNSDTKLTREEMDYNIKVRGRIFNNSKPETFNQLWSCEEQKRLEELLEVYPEEPVELRRYKKIAEALGTRTTMQVTSRIQKYFAKLAKAGLPIPGRAPKGIARDKNRSFFYKKSTFFPQLHVPVKMEDPYDSGEPQSSTCLDTKSESKNFIEMLKAAKEQRILDEQCPVYQMKTMCVGCQKTGFLGARWTDNAGTDYCTDCIVKHIPAEKLIPIRQPL